MRPGLCRSSLTKLDNSPIPLLPFRALHYKIIIEIVDDIPGSVRAGVDHERPVPAVYVTWISQWPLLKILSTNLDGFAVKVDERPAMSCPYEYIRHWT